MEPLTTHQGMKPFALWFLLTHVYNPGTTKEMEPLTTHLEVVLASDDQNDRTEQVEKEGKDMKKDNYSLSKTGTENGSSFSTENNEATNENRQSGSDVGYTLNSDDALNNAQEDLRNESASDDMSVAHHRSPGTPPLSETEMGYGSLAASNFENLGGSIVTGKSDSVTELKENLIDAKLTNSSVSGSIPTDLSTDDQKDVSGLSGTDNSNFSFDSSYSSTISIPIESLPSIISVNSPLVAVIEPQVVHKMNGETVNLLSTGKNLDLSKSHVSEEGNNPSLQEHNLEADGSNGTTSLSPVANPFANERDGDSYNNLNESATYFESTGRGNSFSSAGIPAAPSVVSAALQVLPGKVLVSAVVDHVQGQALAALQVLKVPIYFIIIWVILLSLDPVAATESSASDNGNKATLIMIFVVVGVFLFIGLLYWLHGCLVRRRSTLDPTVVDSFPMVLYPITSDVGFGAKECHICLDEFTDGAWVKVLPQCRHIYHSDCIRQWLTSRKARCPVCSYDYSRRDRPADFLP